MNHYIKNSNGVVRDKNCSITLQNNKNTHQPYNKYLPPEYIINPQFFIETINFNIGQNLITKPYTRLS